MAQISNEEALRMGLGIRYTPAQIAALCGGKLPEASGFNWKTAGHFIIEDGVLHAYSGPDPLPAPGLKVEIREVEFGVEEREEAIKELIRDLARRLKELHRYFPSCANGDLDPDWPEQGKKPEECVKFLSEFLKVFRVEGYSANEGWFRFVRPSGIEVNGGTFTDAALLAEFGRQCRAIGVEISVRVGFDR